MKLPYSTLSIMLNAHNGQVDKSGEVYALHPIRVAYRLAPTRYESLIRAALLHEVIEDTQVTEAELQRLGEPAEVVSMVLWVSRLPPYSETYLDWIRRIATTGPIGARLVKLADIFDNLSTGRMAAFNEDERASLTKRYEKAIGILAPSIPDDLFKQVLHGDVTPELDFWIGSL
jgi:(p)ppGpp synthase/HD superfamily hydrolase